MTQHDPALLSAALAGAERALNQTIALTPTSHQELEALSGTLLGIDITSLDLTLFIDIISGTEIALLAHCERRPDAFVRGTVEDFAALVASDDPAATLINSGIELEGSSTKLITLQQIVSKMDVDWEAPLVDALGDVMGHQLAQALRAMFRWSESARASLKRQLSEYLLEEGKLTPPKAELEHFYDSVQSLSLRVERAQSQVANCWLAPLQTGRGNESHCDAISHGRALPTGSAATFQPTAPTVLTAPAGISGATCTRDDASWRAASPGPGRFGAGLRQIWPVALHTPGSSAA